MQINLALEVSQIPPMIQKNLLAGSYVSQFIWPIHLTQKVPYRV